MQLVRFGVSLPKSLIEKFDKLIKKKNYPNRSEAIRDLIRQSLIDEEVTSNQEVIGILHLLYDHHKRELSDKLNHIQHDHHELIISSTHVHLNHDNCVEVILLRGKGEKIKKLADKLIATIGVINGRLYITSTGEKIK
jgi:CopG family transcriptional regulator, nickel-responsive regulator